MSRPTTDYDDRHRAVVDAVTLVRSFSLPDTTLYPAVRNGGRLDRAEVLDIARFLLAEVDGQPVTRASVHPLTGEAA